MAPSSDSEHSSEIPRVPSIDDIERELDDIWPGWTKTPKGDPRNVRLKPNTLPPAWYRRVKWLLKAHSLHRSIGPTGRTMAEEGWGVGLVADPRNPTRWFAHPLPPVAVRPLPPMPEDPEAAARWRGMADQRAAEVAEVVAARAPPEAVHGPPPGHAAPVRKTGAGMSAAAVAVELRIPLPEARRRLADCPPDADPLEWARGHHARA